MVNNLNRHMTEEGISTEKCSTHLVFREMQAQNDQGNKSIKNMCLGLNLKDLQY